MSDPIRKFGRYIFDHVGLRDEKKLAIGGSGAQTYWGSSFQMLRGPNPPVGFWADCPSTGFGDPSYITELYDDFVTLDAGSGRPWMLNQASGYVTVENSDTSGVVAQGGVIKIGVGAQSGDNAYLKKAYGDKGGSFALNSGKPLWYEIRMNSVAAQGAGQNWIAGLLDPVTTTYLYSGGTLHAASGAGMYFRSAYNSGTLINTGVAASGVETAVQVGLVNNSGAGFQTLRMKYDGNDTIGFYHGDTTGTLCFLSSGQIATGEPLTPVVGLNTIAAAGKHLWVDWIKVVQKR